MKYLGFFFNYSLLTISRVQDFHSSHLWKFKSRHYRLRHNNLEGFGHLILAVWQNSDPPGRRGLTWVELHLFLRFSPEILVLYCSAILRVYAWNINKTGLFNISSVLRGSFGSYSGQLTNQPQEKNISRCCTEMFHKEVYSPTGTPTRDKVTGCLLDVKKYVLRQVGAMLWRQLTGFFVKESWRAAHASSKGHK